MVIFFFEVLIIGLAVFYCGTLIWLRLGLTRLKSGNSFEQPLISVVIAARNEQHNIGACLNSLLKQTYPKESTEIIIVDDRSEDDTASIVRTFSTDHPELKITLKQIHDCIPDMSPKKRALELGIREAAGEIIFVTDADCQPMPFWLEQTMCYFESSVGLVVGFAPLELPSLKTLGNKLAALDSLALAAVSAGSASWGWPASASGRNLAYRKSVFEQVNGFERIRHYVSGDDDLFLHTVKTMTKWDIRYAATHKAAVKSFAPKSLVAFMHQRIRHASKGRHYGGALTAILITVYAFNIMLFTALPLMFLGLLGFVLVLLTLLAKMLFEFILVSGMAKRMKRWQYLNVFPLAAFLHIPYVVVFGLLGQIMKFEWKGDTFAERTAKN